MTDTFLDTHTTTTLTGDLTIIATSSAELLRIARRETSPPGGRAARNPNGYTSRPPVAIGALSASHEMHNCLTGWARCLKDDTGIRLPDIPDEKGLALHLRQHTHRIAQQTWADDAAAEIGHWANVIHSVTAPPADKKMDDYTDEQRAAGIEVAKVSASLCAELVDEYSYGAHSPTPDLIRKWARRGHIDRWGPETARIYSVAQVLEHCRRKAS